MEFQAIGLAGWSGATSNDITQEKGEISIHCVHSSVPGTVPEASYNAILLAWGADKEVKTQGGK